MDLAKQIELACKPGKGLISTAITGIFSFMVWTLEFFVVLWIVCKMTPGLFSWILAGLFIYLIPWMMLGAILGWKGKI